jgi:type IV pilus assembly protein PilM
MITNPEELGSYLSKQLRENRIKIKEAIFTITSGRIAVRDVTLPPMRANRVKAAIDANATEYFPVDLASYRIAHTILDAPPDEKVRVMVFAAPIALISGYAKTAEAAGLKLVSIDYAGNSQFELYKQINSPEITMYACVDHSVTYLTFMRGNVLLLQRTLQFGGSDLVDEFLTATKRDSGGYIEASKALTDTFYSGAAGVALGTDGAHTSLERLVSGISRSLAYFNSNYGGDAVERVVLTGPCGKLYQLKSSVAAEMSQPVYDIDELDEATDVLPDVSEVFAYFTGIGATISPLGLEPEDAKSIEREEKKTAKKEEKAKSQSMVSGIVMIMVGIIAAGALIFISSQALKDAQDAKASTEKQITQLEPAELLYQEYEYYLTGAAAVVALDVSLKSPNDALADFFEEMERKMPSEILTLSAVCAPDKITMTMEVPTKTDAARVMSQFRTFESIKFDGVIVDSLTETLNEETGKAKWTFSIVCEYAPPEVPSPSPATGGN